MEFHRQDSKTNVIDQANVCNTRVDTPGEQLALNSRLSIDTVAHVVRIQIFVQCGGSRFATDSLAPVLHSASQCEIQRICSYGARTLEENECSRERAKIRSDPSDRTEKDAM